ncbi:MAG: phosphoglycerate mutase family protein [bacterium]|nr:phosphoglycerate mutase family protein [bacterium]
MKLMIACRHGHAIGNSLTGPGKQQSSKLAGYIKNKINGASNISLLASPLQRAVETAVIIGKTLGVRHQLCDKLKLIDFKFGQIQMEAILDLAGNSDVVVAVTHHEAPSGIINAFRQKHFDRGAIPEVIHNGSAICLCMEYGDIRYIYRDY